MSFGWQRKIKVEKLDASKRRMITETTPKDVLKSPYGHRQEDIVHSLVIVANEYIKESEEKADRLKKLFENLGENNGKDSEEKSSEESKEESIKEDSGERNNNDPLIIFNPPQA